MANPSNLYAEKVFAEHPVGLWTLDDDVDYLSYIVEDNRKFYDYTSQWTYTGITPSGTVSSVQASTEYVLENFNFKDSAITKISIPYTESPNSIDIESSGFTIDTTQKSICVGFYIYSTVDLSDVAITITADGGYSQEISNGVTKQNKQDFIQGTFQTPDGLSNAKIKITISYNESLADHIYLNGLSVGTNSEEFCAVSLGVNTEILSETVGVSLVDSVKAYAYGSDADFGYYFAENQVLLAQHTSIPMVYGSKDLTKFLPSQSGDPSLILPGMGFLNESGRQTSITLECWIKIIGNNASNRRILGPVSGTDGLYLDGPFLMLKIGNNVCSYFIEEFYRPMLVDIVIGKKTAKLLVNGDIVAKMDINKKDLTFAPTDLDWIGFYCHKDEVSIELDCVAIYTYEVDSVLAKKRFVYGQGVAYPEDINVAYSGESVMIDYAFANYSKIFEYPTYVGWNTGSTDNISLSKSAISSPKPELPVLVSSDSNASFSLLESDLGVFNVGSNRAITLNYGTWANRSSYLYFDSLNILSSPVSAIFGFFKQSVSGENEQVLIKIQNKETLDYFKVSLFGTTLSYVYKQNNEDEFIINNNIEIELGTVFPAGLVIDDLITYDPNFAEFFGNRHKLSVSLLGDYSDEDQSLSTTFDGLLTKFCLLTKENTETVYPEQHRFTDYGLVPTNLTEDIATTSYELVFSKILGTIPKIEINTSSSWSSSIPLSYFATMQKNSVEKKLNKLDFIQINFNYPEKRSLEDMKIDPRDDLVKVYVTFQQTADGANNPISNYTDLLFDYDNILVVRPDESDWLNESRYQVVNGSIIYVPTDVDFESLSLCIHVELISKNSNISPISFNSLKLTSQSYADNSSSATSPINGIGTKFGKNIYPYKETNLGSFPSDISFSQNVPVKIYDKSLPHLYLTSSSGIALAQDMSEINSYDQGLFFILNENKSGSNNINSMQLAMLWNYGLFSDLVDVKLFEFTTPGLVYRFYAQALSSDGTRAKIVCKIYSFSSDQESIAENIYFYTNGQKTYSPIITMNQWLMFGFTFKTVVELSDSIGYFKLTSPLLINNISTYQLDSSSADQQITYRAWSDVVSDYPDWQGVQDANTWQSTLYSKIDVDPKLIASEIYKNYIGTNKVVADSQENSGVVRLNKYQYSFYDDVQWNSYIASPL